MRIILFKCSVLALQPALFHDLCLLVTLGFEIISWSRIGIISANVKIIVCDLRHYILETYLVFLRKKCLKYPKYIYFSNLFILSRVVKMAVPRRKMFLRDLVQEVSFHFKYVGECQ